MSENAPENSPFPRAGFTMLAPMQDVTTLPFMRLLARRGAPDFFVTEFLRVSATSPIDDSVAECAEKTLPLTGKPLLVQLLGEDVPALTRVAREVLERFAETVAGIDFNLGCPMPKIFRRNVGGGLLRDLAKVEEILGALRRVCADFGKLFTVKCRLGFEDAAPFSQALLDSAGAARAVWLAQGDYPLDAPLRVPAGAALLGGFDPETGRRAPLDAPSTLTLRATYQNAMVVFGDGATLDGLRLEDPDGGAGVMLQPEEDAKGASATLRACVLSGGRNNNLAQDVDFVCCVFMNAGAIAAPECTALHCTFAGTLGDGTDAGGNRLNAGAEALARPIDPTPCPAEGHVCPEAGLDGRPLSGALGALGPNAPGYRLLLR